MPTLEEIRRKKLEELMQLQQNKAEQQQSEQAQFQQQIEIMEETVRQFMTKEALERYGNLRAAHTEKALQLMAMLYQAIKKGQLQSKIDDGILKKILAQITPKKREIRINRV